MTLRQHLAHAGEDAEAPPPIGAFYLVGWFWQLSNRRGSGMGLSPITWEAIDAWARRSGNDPEPWEIGVIEQMDDAYVSKIAARQ